MFVRPAFQNEPLLRLGMNIIPVVAIRAQIQWLTGWVPGLLIFAPRMVGRARIALNSIAFCLLFLGGIISHAIEFEHISLQKKADLESEFEKAKLEASDAPQVESKKWTCDMFGVRSRMQVQRNVKLYSLKRDGLGAYANTGAQVISSYSALNGSLQGKNERFEDQVRLTGNGQLISRLSLRGQDAPGSSTVIAYSICKSM